jgi:midasin
VATALQLLRLSNYLFGFILGNLIDYSALQVVVRWINEALKAAPPGFENIVTLTKKLDSFVRLSSGWAFYDIWNAFLTDGTPNADGQPLEILGRIPSVTGNTGKET